jgi:hypothetical protein
MGYPNATAVNVDDAEERALDTYSGPEIVYTFFDDDFPLFPRQPGSVCRFAVAGLDLDNAPAIARSNKPDRHGTTGDTLF